MSRRAVLLPLLALLWSCGSAEVATDPGPGAETTTGSTLVQGASLMGIHFLPLEPDGGGGLRRPGWMGGTRLWDVEMIHGVGTDWFYAGGCHGATICAQYATLAANAVDVVTRLDYYLDDGGVRRPTVPVTQAGIDDWKNRLGKLFQTPDGAVTRFSRVFIVGNEPNLCVEAGGDEGCAPASRSIAAATYVQAYRAVRESLRSRAAAMGHGEIAVLLAGPSGAGAGGLGYLSQQLQAACDSNTPVDGVALHAYGGDDAPGADGTYGFSRMLREQIAMVDSACAGRFRGAGLFVSEFSRGNRPATDNDFVYRAVSFVHDWNSTGHHAVLGMTYFVGDHDAFRFESLVRDQPNAHHRAREAFQAAAARNFPAGNFGWGSGGGNLSDAGGFGCACRAGINNYCQLPSGTPGCPMTARGGYCDRNGDGNYGDADWGRGALDYGWSCGTHCGNRVCDQGETCGSCPADCGPCGEEKCQYFAETDYTVCGKLLEYWNKNGGLPIFGYPITSERAEPVEGQTFRVQWFQRNRLELHPENQSSKPYDVLLGRLGAQLRPGHEAWTSRRPGETRAGCEWISPLGDDTTGNWSCSEIRSFFHAHGLDFGDPGYSLRESMQLLGAPIGPEEDYTSPDGKTYRVQWFERARLERHPENAGGPFYILGGLLGCSAARAAGAIPQHWIPGC